MTSREVMLEGGSPWGFRMHGGVDQQQPLKVSRVNPGSKAALKGIREGDVITSINTKSTRDITNSEAHALLKNAGSTLTLGLNEELNNSPKRRQYRTVHQETQSEIIKRSSLSSITGINSETSDTKDDINTETISSNEGTRSNGLTSQRSTLSSTGSSAPSTPSDTKADNTDANCIQNVDLSILTSSDVMADISNNISRSRRRRNRRKSKRNGNTNTATASSSSSETLISEDISIDLNETTTDVPIFLKSESSNQSLVINESNLEINKKSESKETFINEHVTIKTATEKLMQEELNYRVESPPPITKKATSPKNGEKKSPVKSRSLDDDDIKITELSESSETEEKTETSAIIAEVESESDMDLEETKNLSVTDGTSKKADLIEIKTNELEAHKMEQPTILSSDDEEHLKVILTSMKNQNSDEKESQTKDSTLNVETPKARKAKKRAELAQYFIPVYQNPRYLEAISEESSDLSDKEQMDSRKRSVKVSKVKHGKRYKAIEVTEQPKLLDTKIIDNINVAHTICKVETTEKCSGAELVYIEDSGPDTETDDYAEIDDDEFNDPLETNSTKSDQLLSDEGTYMDEEETNADTKSIPLTQLTPPPTPENEKSKSQEFVELHNMNEFIKSIETHILERKQKEIQATLSDPRYLCLPNELKDKINYIVQSDCPDKVVEAALYSNVITPTPSRSPSAGSDSGSSRATSLCTSRYNPNSSVGDIKSIDMNNENPVTLRELCVNKLITLPFGTEILEELAEVSRNLQDLTQLSRNVNKQTKQLPAFMEKDTLHQEINNNSLKIAANSQQTSNFSKKWVGLQSEEDPNLLVCVSPTQRILLDETKRIPNEADKLLDLHDKFINRRSYQETETCENPLGKNRLLAIIKSSSLDDEYNTDSFEEQPPPVPPRPKFHRSLSALPTIYQSTNNEARLNAQNLSEWLHLARNKSTSESNLNHLHNKLNNMRAATSMSCILEDDKKQTRRSSLPPDLYQKQMEDILRKEREVEEEIKKLEAEKTRLNSARNFTPERVELLPNTTKSPEDNCVENESTKTTSTTFCKVKQVPIEKVDASIEAKEVKGEVVENIIPITLEKGFEVRGAESESINRTTSTSCHVKQIPITLETNEKDKDESYEPKENVVPITIEKDLQKEENDSKQNVRIIHMKIERELPKSPTKIIPIEIENDVTATKSKITQRDINSYKSEVKESFEERFKRFFEHKTQGYKPSSIMLDNSGLNPQIRNINIQREDSTNIINNNNNNDNSKNQTTERIIPIKIDNLESKSQMQTGVKKETIIPITLTNANSGIINRKENIMPIKIEANEKTLKLMEENKGEPSRREKIIPIELENERNSINNKNVNSQSANIKERTIPITLEENDKVFEPKDYFISKQGDIAIFNEESKSKRPFLNTLPSTEMFRQQMFEEYKNQMAERMERKHHKVIKMSSLPEDNTATNTNFIDVIHIRDIENEFIDKAKRRMVKYGIKLDGSPAKEGSSERSDADDNKEEVLIKGDEILKNQKKLPKHLKEFVDITRQADNTIAEDGIWSPGQQSSSTYKSESPLKSSQSNVDDEPMPPVWTPKSTQSSPTSDRKEFKPVNFKSPTLGRKNRFLSESAADSVEHPWKSPATNNEIRSVLTATLEKRIPNSYSAPASGFADLNGTSRLPRAQNPTITLLQKAREGQLPRGAYYLEKDDQFRTNDKVNPREIVYEVKRDYTSESESERPIRRMADIPRNFDGIGPTANDGMPLTLRSEVRDVNQSRWYKKMYDTIHKQKSDGRYPYTSGYFSEPDPATYDSDASDFKFATLDRRRLQSNNRDKENEYMSSTMPRNTTVKYSIPVPSVVKHGQDSYRNQPGRIENYVPGHSSISDKEAKEWWDEVMDIFDGWLEDHTAIPSYNYLLSRAATRSHLEQQRHVPQPRSFINQALKESGYESDSTLVFRRRDDTAQQLSPLEQKEAYKTIQKGGDVPLQGLRKPAPERPKDDADIEYFPISPTLNRIRVHKSAKPKTEVLCYPINVPPHPPHVFASYKRTAPSASTIPKPPPIPPSPPKRKSSRNNSTLRLISTMKIRPDKSPSTKRHETCFTPSTGADKHRVKYLRDKLTCKLSPKKKGEDKPRLRVTKTLTTSPSLKSKISSTLTTNKDTGKITSKTNLGTKTEKYQDRCCARSSSASPIRKMCKQCTLDVERQLIKPTTSRGTSLERTFGLEKKKVDMMLPKSKRLVKSPDLLSPTEVKRAVLSQSSSPIYRKTTSLLSSVKNGTRSIHKEQSIPIKVGFTDKGKELIRTGIRPKSLPGTPLLNRSNLRISSPSPSNISKTRSNISLNSISSRSSRDTHKVSPSTSKPSSTIKSKTKSKKDMVNGEIAKKGKDKKIPTKSSTLPKKFVKTTASNVSLSDIKRQKEAVQSDTFFQNLFLRDKPEATLSSSVPTQTSWIAEKASMLTRRRSSVSEPSIRALKIYLNHTKPVSDSKFRTIDAIRSRSASPKTISWRKDTREIVKKVKRDERSSSLPPKLVFTETSRPVSPVIIHRKSKIDSTKKSDQIRKTASPKLIFTETSRPVSPIVQRSKSRDMTSSRRRSPTSKILLPETHRIYSPRERRYYAEIQGHRRSESPKFYSTETSRPISPIIERRYLKTTPAKRSESPKFYSTETSRPVSPIVERRYPKTKSVRRSESPKFYSTETSRPVSPMAERRYYDESKKALKRSESPKLHFTETSRPISPLTERRLTKRDIINTELIRRRTPSPPKLIFTETSRPVSPLVERRYVIREPSPEYVSSRRSVSPRFVSTETSRPISPMSINRRTSIRSAERKLTTKLSPERKLPAKLIFTETSRPVSPVIQRKRMAVSLDDASHFFDTPDYEKKLYFTETNRPVSPVIEHRSRRKSPSPNYEPVIVQKSCKMKNIRSRSAGDTDQYYEEAGPSSLTLSTCSIDSIDRKEYQSYIKELQQSTKKSAKFKELNNFFSTLERMGDLERTTSSAELRPRRKNEDEIIDYERWKEVRTRERAEKELHDLYKVLKDHQKEKGLLFLPKDVETYKWKKQLDRGLRLKEKSVENIKEDFERLKLEESCADLAKRRDISYTKDTYKPLWRGNSVMNLAHSMVERRSQSEGRYKTIPNRAESQNIHGIGSHIWSSLSMEQVNILKHQLNEIYSQGNNNNNHKKSSDEQTDNSINVPEEKMPTIRSKLTVRRNSDSAERNIPPPPPQMMTTSLIETTNRQLSETDKRKLSQSLSREVLDRVSERKKKISPSLVFGKETRGAIAAADAKIKYPEATSPRTCYSLELSEDGHEKESNKDSQFVLVLTDKNSDKAKIANTMHEFAQPKAPLTKTDAITTLKSSNSETESSTDGSTRTVVYAGNKADVLKKVEYFENASDRDVYTPIVHKPAENGVGEDVEDYQETITKPTNLSKLSHSQSFQNIKELFGEQELVKFATVPLSESRKVFKTDGPQLRATSLSPVRSTISATSTDSLCRSRSLSPYPEDSLAVARYGDVNRLKNRFENLDDYARRRLFNARRWRSDPQLDRKRIIYIPGQPYGEVDNLRRKYEYPAIAGRGRSRVRRGVVSPVYLRAEDRLMPHINIISKIASLYPRRSVSPQDEKRKSNEELAEIFGIPLGEVEKMRQRFDSPDRMSLLGHMFTSSPDIQELRDISPYLTASWIAHRYPRKEDNTRSLSSPEHSFSTRDTSKIRKDRHRPKSASPISSPKSKPSSILKIKESKQDLINNKMEQKYDPSIHQPVSRYQPDVPKQDQLRYRSWWPPIPTQNRPTVTFKEPDGPIPPPKGHHLVRNPPIPESPRKYVENEVTIHYRTPVRQEIKESISEDELARRQAEVMKKIYQEERRRKYLQVSQSLDELQDMNSRRHADNFIPSQKSPIPLNRYDDVVDSFSPKVKPRPRSPEPRLVARALFNFVGQSARELTFRKGDIIYIKRQVDKNWYEGEFNAMIGLFPANYVEIIPYDGVKTTPRKSHEGQARAKYNFIAQTHLELSLAKGELVVITRKVDTNWYEGKIGGRKGIFPVAYVEVLIDPSDPPQTSAKPVASPAAHSLLLNGSSGGKESMGTHSYTPVFQNQQLTTSYHAKPVQITGSGTYGTLTRKSPLDQTLHIDTQSEPVPYKALYKYRPQNDDELELFEGDTVFVLEKCDDGWFVGSSDRTGAFGTFPGNYVERI